MSNQISKGSPEVVVSVQVMVDVIRVQLGAVSNTASGLYLFILSEDVVHVDAPGVRTNISYVLTDDALGRGFSFTGAYVSDTRSQLTGPYLTCANTGNAHNLQSLPDTISFLHSNTHASLISISLQVRDSTTQKPVAYDPQLTNDPGT